MSDEKVFRSWDEIESTYMPAQKRERVLREASPAEAAQILVGEIMDKFRAALADWEKGGDDASEA